MVAVSTVSPGETMNWANQRASASQNLLSSKTQNAYQQQLGNLDYGKNLANFTRQFDDARMQIPTQFAQRGTLNSGLYRSALARYAQERSAGFGSLQNQQQVSQGGFIFQDREAEDGYAAALQRILGEQYARQATMAGTIGSWV